MSKRETTYDQFKREHPEALAEAEAEIAVSEAACEAAIRAEDIRAEERAKVLREVVEAAERAVAEQDTELDMQDSWDALKEAVAALLAMREKEKP